MRLALLVLPALLLATACSVQKDVGSMSEKTTQLAEAVEEQSEAQAESRDLQAWVAFVQRQSDGYGTRRTAFESMGNADTLNLKLAEAQAYFFHFDFQTANYTEITGVDLRQVRDELVALSVSELGKMVPELLPEGRNRYRLDATKTDDKNLSAMALASSLHEINPLQGPQGAAVGLNAISMYDVVAEGLSRKSAVNNGRGNMDSLSRPVREVLREEQLFTFLMQLRLRALPVIVIDRISNVRTNNIFEDIGMNLFGWEPKFDELNVEQINHAAQQIELALQTRQMLERLGIEAKLDRKTESILKKMKLEDARESLDAGAETEKVRALDRFESAMGALLPQ